MLTTYVYDIQLKKQKKLLVVAGVFSVGSKRFEWMLHRILSSLFNRENKYSKKKEKDLWICKNKDHFNENVLI